MIPFFLTHFPLSALNTAELSFFSTADTLERRLLLLKAQMKAPRYFPEFLSPAHHYERHIRRENSAMPSSPVSPSILERLPRLWEARRFRNVLKSPLSLSTLTSTTSCQPGKTIILNQPGSNDVFAVFRYQISGELDLKGIVTDEALETRDKKQDTKKKLKLYLQDRYINLPEVKGPNDKTSHVKFLFKKLRF